MNSPFTVIGLSWILDFGFWILDYQFSAFSYQLSAVSFVAMTSKIIR
jgi:hypothetical protein